MSFDNLDGIEIPSLSADQMREIDRIAVEEFKLSLLQMMENAGRNLAEVVMSKFEKIPGPVLILAGSGGNGGGGLAAARHLHNHGIDVRIILAKSDLGQAAQNQLNILQKAGLQPLEVDQSENAIREASVVIDAMIGYNLKDSPRGHIADLIQQCNQNARQVLSLDIPSGVDATTGEAPGEAIQPKITVTLALPKSGLTQVEGKLFLADIGIPPQAYWPLGIHFEPFFTNCYWIPIARKTN